MPDGGSFRARFDAAQPSQYHGAPPASGHPDLDIYQAGQRLRDWARDLAANSSIANAVLDDRCAAGVGAGLTYEPMVRDRAGNLLGDLNKAIRRVMRDWAAAADVTGELSRAEIERLAWRAWDLDGEIFGRRVYRGRTAARPGVQIQLIESDRVPYGWIANGAPALGVERDEWGSPMRYWVEPYRHNQVGLSYLMPNPVAVSADDIRHLRRQQRPGQTRGVPLLAPVILRIADVSEYMQSHRLAARASADQYLAVQRAIDLIDADTTKTDTAGTPLAAGEYPLSNLQRIDLGPGESAVFLAPAHPNQSAPDFVSMELRQIASGTRSSFSGIAQIFDASYAAQRLEVVRFYRLIGQDRDQFVADFARPLLYETPLRVALAEGRFPVRLLRRADPATLLDVRVDGPAMPVIDPVKDRQADELDQINGWDSRHGIIRRRGRDPGEVDAERATDTAAREEPRQQTQRQVEDQEERD